MKIRKQHSSSAYDYRALSCYVIAAMLEGKNNTFSLLWEIRSIFMQNCFIVSALQHGCRENPLYMTKAVESHFAPAWGIILYSFTVGLGPIALISKNNWSNNSCSKNKFGIITAKYRPTSGGHVLLVQLILFSTRTLQWQ